MEGEDKGQLNEGKISKVLGNIPEQYHKSDFQARRAALDFMRSNNLKDTLIQIENWLDEINGVTDDIVEAYFQGFNKSIHNYSRILEFMGDSHSNALSMGSEVEEINKLIFFNNLGIERLWRRNLEQYYMIQILEKIEELKLVPELLDRYIESNHFVHSSNLLVNALNELAEKELINVGGLKDLRQVLTERKEEFKDNIVEKLNDHIYLKTEQSLKMSEEEENKDDFNSNLKRAISDNIGSTGSPALLSPPPQSNGSTASPKKDAKKPSLKGTVSTNVGKRADGERESKANARELLKLEEISKTSNSIEDLNINPETDGKLFMRLLVESLDVLNYLQPAVGMILGKISIELKAIINDCTNEVTQVYLSEGRVIPRLPGEVASHGSSSSSSSHHDDQSMQFLSDTFSRNDLVIQKTLNQNIPLVDLLRMIFKKVTTVLKNHIFLSKIFNQAIEISDRKARSDIYDIKSSMEIHIDEDTGEEIMVPTSGPIVRQSDEHHSEDLYSPYLVWEIVQKELRELLKIHLHDTSSILLTTNLSNANGTREATQSHKTSKLFSFNNSIVTDSWNGSTSPILSSSSTSSFTSPMAKSAGIGSSGGVIGIFKSSQYNITAVYPAIIKFTDSIQQILKQDQKKQSFNDFGANSQTLRLYVDDFVLMNFLQHIKNDYKERIQACVEATEAFKPLERYKLVFKLRETKPILNSALQIFQFVSELFQDIVSMPQYVVEFGAIIQGCLLRYYEKCVAKFNQELESTLTNTLIETDLFKYLITALDRLERKQEPQIKFQDSREEEYEYKLESEFFLNPERPVQKSHLMLDIEKLTMIANINHSLEWLADKVSQLFLDQHDNSLNSVQSTPSKTQAPQSTPLKAKVNLSASTNAAKTPKIGSQKTILPPETIASLAELDITGIVKSYKDLARRCLISLRIEYRVHCFYYLEGFKRTSYLCEEERAEQDSFIVDLNKDLSKNEETMSIYLTNDKCQFLFGGIAKLIGKLFIARLSTIKQINTNGVSKICKNIFTLQQNLSNIIVKREIFFDRIRQFYQALLVEDEFLNYIVEKLAIPYFSLEEGKIIFDFLKTTRRISDNALQTVEAKYKLMMQQ